MTHFQHLEKARLRRAEIRRDRLAAMAETTTAVIRENTWPLKNETAKRKMKYQIYCDHCGIVPTVPFRNALDAINHARDIGMMDGSWHIGAMIT